MDISETVDSDSHEEWWLSWLLSMFLTFSRLRNHDWHVCSPVGSFYRSGNWYLLNCCFPSPKIWRCFDMGLSEYEHMVSIYYIYIYPRDPLVNHHFPIEQGFCILLGDLPLIYSILGCIRIISDKIAIIIHQPSCIYIYIHIIYIIYIYIHTLLLFNIYSHGKIHF